VRIAVIGGGAAGIFGAIAAASGARAVSVEVLEATHQPLDKVLISGGGRCNVTHNCFEPRQLVESYPRGARELLGAFSRFQPRDTVAWFARQGVELKAESDGRMFPVTDRSETIADCLLEVARQRGVKIRLGARVRDIALKTTDGPTSLFAVTLHDGSMKKYDRVLMATGNNRRAYQLVAALGHSVVAPVPSLFTFKIPDPRLTGLSGLSFGKVKLRLTTANGATLHEAGPMLVTHWGLSGPAVLKLSAWGARELNEAGYKATLTINLCPELQAESLYHELLAYKNQHPRKHVFSGVELDISRRFWQRLIELQGIGQSTTWSELSHAAIRTIVSELTTGEYRVSGRGEFKEEFVTCGGVRLSEVDFRTMQSRICPGLFFAGEILDIDGITGGFNFQSAWTTGWIAGSHMAR
jgi:predicted Rossmann fold flavoprotein